MKKKKVFPDDKSMNALDDTRIYGAGHEGDETLNEEDEIHTNGGIPDETGDDTDDDESDDNRA